MKRPFIFNALAVFLWFSQCAGAAAFVSPDPYYGKVSSEATLSFDHHVEFTSATKAEATDEVTQEAIEDQVQYLFGPMGVSGHKSVPKTDHTLSGVSVERLEGAGNRYRASYHYFGHIVVENGVDGDYRLTLPIDPHTIYSASIVVDAQGKKTYPCNADLEHLDEEDFWYFWNPQLSGCPLKRGVDYEWVTAQVHPLPNTVQTYPEYSRLVSNEGTVRIFMWFGMNDPKEDRNPYHSGDANAASYTQFRQEMLTMGFSEKVLSDQEDEELLGKQSEVLPWIQEFYKQTPKGQIAIWAGFGPSAMDSDVRAFHYFLKWGIENGSVVMYSGHSGLGDYLDLEHIERKEGFTINFPKSSYQIYFFNSCSSYPYYGNMYFDRKKTASDSKGTKNLDILTNGLSTFFSYAATGDVPLVRAINDWASGSYTESYQQIIGAADTGDLLGVNGDEDNPTEPGGV